MLKKPCEGPTNNFKLVLEIFLEFFGIYLGHIWQKTIFYSKQNCQNKSKGVFAKQPRRQNIPQQNSNQPNKTIVPDSKQNKTNWVDSKTLIQP